MTIYPENKKEQESWKLFSVTFHVDATGTCKVWAKDEEHACRLAEDLFLPGVDNTEFGDPQQIVGVSEVER